ncbi:transglycosylase domain-containing protein [Candidatus Saccharibacteria bacterium]|nr:transglycosylase domain-containing protein [Candidatus Saccharibacteria bacterium]
MTSETAKKNKAPKKSFRKSLKKKNMNVYSSLSHNYKTKKDANARKRAEELAKLPKEPVKRFFAKLHPKRVFKWWFSWRGQKAILKFIAACILLGIIAIGGLFLYYKKDLDQIRLDEMSIAETVNTYLDRNGVVLWRDTGTEDYRLVVDKDNISDYMYKATIAIEDKNFYNHMGVDFGALIRATFATLSGKGVQGGSTLTQQLIKQVYFSDEAVSANRGGLTRKIKELILAVELERMYDKEQIITMYLNQSPYGGRRNGVESASKTYFGKTAKELTLAESALLAAIPNNPAVLDPYNPKGHELLIERQHKVLDDMVSMGYITADEATAAKEVAILDTIQPESSQYEGILAPHFVLEVKSQLEEKYGVQTMRTGGWTITTTLDYRAQQIAESAVAAGAELFYTNGSDNISLVSLDVETSQVVAMVGSVDFNNVEYGSYNAANSLIEPGSTIKPVLDYAPLFMQREGINYAPGTILRDENIDRIYCAGNVGPCVLRNATRQFFGNITIRQALSNSLNIPAVKALYINGIDNSLETLHALGDKSYCADRENYGLSIAIGSGCNVRLTEHANTYASLARGGSYKDMTYVLELKNSSGEIIERWVDNPGTKVVEDQVAYMIWDILHDPVARASLVWGSQSYSFGFVVPGVKTASKTGTTTTTTAEVAKDSLMVSYSSALSTVVWNGNHDGSGLSTGSNTLVRRVVNNYMEGVHHNVYGPDGRWNTESTPVRPAGLQTLTVNGKTDIFPSWYNASKNSGVAKDTLTFNKYNHLLAASCTAEEYKISIEVTKITDPMTGNEVVNVPAPYNRDKTDPCDYKPPRLSLSTKGNSIEATVKKGTYDMSCTLYVDGVEVSNPSFTCPNADKTFVVYTVPSGKSATVKFVISDSAGYTAVDEKTIKATSSSS